MNQHEQFMALAVDLSRENIEKGGGPFGAIIVKDGQVVGKGANRVTVSLDPTAHAEVEAIRNACQTLKTFDLSECEIYTSCEPCPMCLSAIYWARLGKIYYGNTKKDAAQIEFDDDFIYQELAKSEDQRQISMTQISRSEALKVFNIWKNKTDKVPY